MLEKSKTVAREILQEATEPEVVPPVEVPPTLDSAPLAKGNAGGGVRLPPPPLQAPGDGLAPEDAALESLAALETAALPAGQAGGGGVRLPPPRLMGPEEQSMAEQEEAVAAVVASVDAVAAVAAVESVAMVPEVQKAAQVAQAAQLTKSKTVAREMLQESTEPEVVPPVEMPPALDSAPLPVGKSAGGGVRLPPPTLLAPPDGLDADEAAIESLAAIETAVLPVGRAGGGGVRLPPPRLMGPEEQSAVEQEEAVEAVTAAVAAEVFEVPAPLEKTKTVSRELLQESTEPEVVPPVEVPPTLDSAPLAKGNAGGGVRLPPPRLLPVASGSTKTLVDRQEESS